MIKSPHAALLAVFAAGPAHASSDFSAQDATQLIQGTVDQAIEVLKDPELQGREQRLTRHGKLRKISNQVFDWTEMARRSLGVHWRDLNEGQRSRFAKTFREILASHYLGQMDRFQGQEKVTHEGTEPITGGEGYVVKMRLTTQSREQVPIHFFLGQDRKVYDVSIEGVSLTNHYRGNFDRLLVNDSFESVMKKLEAKLEVQRKIEAKAAKESDS